MLLFILIFSIILFQKENIPNNSLLFVKKTLSTKWGLINMFFIKNLLFFPLYTFFSFYFDIVSFETIFKYI